MTRLRKMMLDELERRNYSQTTRRAYLLGVEHFAKHLAALPTSLASTTSATTKSICFVSAS